jgi:hypothetical protein
VVVPETSDCTVVNQKLVCYVYWLKEVKHYFHMILIHVVLAYLHFGNLPMVGGVPGLPPPNMPGQLGNIPTMGDQKTLLPNMQGPYGNTVARLS